MPYGSKNSLKRKEDVVFFADFCPMDGLRHVPKFRPSARLERQISEFVDYHQLSRAAVGVHVRATDKIPPLGFDKLLIKCRSLSLAGEQIFLSTDSSEVESIFKKEFPSLVSLTKNLDGDLKVGLHHRTAATADPDRIQEMADSAIIDMWSLSRCKRLLYQGNSTFSVIARALHKEHAECHDWLTL